MMIQYIYYMALQNQREKALARRLARQQRHIHYMHSRGSGDLDAGGSPLAHRHSDEVKQMLVLFHLLVDLIVSSYVGCAGGFIELLHGDSGVQKRLITCSTDVTQGYAQTSVA